MRTVQELIAALQDFWAEQGCASHHGHDVEVGAGTFNPTTFLRCLGPEPYAAAYVEPSRRPKDGRYGGNPNRMQLFHQFQVILKPSPWDIQKKYLQSLEAIGMNLKEHDIRFVHDDWEQPSLGAWGLGWEVWRDGMEVTQFTYFQSVGGVECKPVTGELAYGIERLAMAVQGVNTVWELKWDETLTYADIFKQGEKEWSHYNFEEADPQMWHAHFKGYVEEAKRMLKKKFPIPAYDFVMKASHAFNILDARGVISVTERARHIHVLRDLANDVAEGYLESRKAMGFPLMREFKNHRPQMASEPLKRGEGDFVLEIGSEELPATFVPIGCANLKRDLAKVLEDFEYDKIEVYGTPRRLTVYVSDLASVKPAEEIERKGPPVSNEKAVEGFKRSVGSAKIEERNGYLFATIKTEEQLTGEILQEALPKLILGLNFPKKMRWSDLDIAYARPLQWIVALHGKCVVPFQVGDIHSGRESSAHPQICPGTFAIERAENYVSDLKNHHVMVDIDERKTSILTQLEAIEGEALSVDAVLPQVLHLTEWPILTTGTFDEKFLNVPPEVLISEMVHHQKYFPLAKDGELVNRFVITADNALTDTIREGNEKVLSARLSDGVFLFEQDSNTPLEAFNEKLHTITFRKGLGTVFDKVLRIIHNVEILGGDETAKRAARLCKADLASELVNEFPDLQGIIGRHYALGQGEDLAVATAIDEHWMPRGENAPLPTSPAGILVSLADKFDNFISCFSLGLKPTSSSDPYALRRQALGVIRILIQNEIRLPLYETIEKCYEHFLSTTNQQPQKDLVQEICDFFKNRIKTVFKDELTPDEIEASLSNDIYEAYCRAKALQKFRKEDPRFVQLAEVYKRAKGLLEEGHTFSEKLLQEDAEKELAQAVTDLENKLDSALKNHAYDTAYAHIAELQAPLAKFFDEVRVVVDDASLKANRQALLYRVFSQFGKLLDFSKLQLGVHNG